MSKILLRINYKGASDTLSCDRPSAHAQNAVDPRSIFLTVEIPIPGIASNSAALEGRGQRWLEGAVGEDAKGRVHRGAALPPGAICAAHLHAAERGPYFAAEGAGAAAAAAGASCLRFFCGARRGGGAVILHRNSRRPGSSTALPAAVRLALRYGMSLPSFSKTAS